MKTDNNKKTHWNICKYCHGQGKIMRGPSKKRRRAYQRQMDAFNDKKIEDLPKTLDSNFDICFDCVGSGLKESDHVTKINPNYPHLAIIGAGIGGTALAVACLHRGIPFTLYERDKNFNARAQGYGLTLQQASKAIQGLGIFSLNDGIISTRHVVHNSKGKIIGEWGLRKWKGIGVEKNSKRKNIHIARQSLRAQLIQELDSNNGLNWNHKFINFSKTKKGRFEINFEVNGKKKTNYADVIVGSDGIRSTVRSQLIDKNKTPLKYLGCIVILGICSLESLKSMANPLLDSATVFQTVSGHERIYVMPYDDKNIMWQLSFPMDEKDAKKLCTQGTLAIKKEALKRIENWYTPIPEIISETLEADITGYPIYDRELFNTELLKDTGNSTLIGDAAHPMSPFKGQGANQALLDALYLARKISVKCDDVKWQKDGLRKLVFNSFEKEMSERTASKVINSRKLVTLLHSDAVLHDGDEPRGRGIGLQK